MAETFWKNPNFKSWVRRAKQTKQDHEPPHKPPIDPVLKTTLTTMPDRAVSQLPSSLETAVRKRLITADDFKDRPQYAIAVIAAQQKQFNQALSQSPDKKETFQIPLLEPTISFGDRIYYDADAKTYTNRPTANPLYFDAENALQIQESDKPAYFDMNTAYEMSKYYEGAMEAIETTVSRESAGTKLYEEVTPESLQALIVTPLSEEPSADVYPVLNAEDEAENISFRDYGFWDKFSAGEELVRHAFSAAYDGKFGKFLSGVSAVVATDLQTLSRMSKSIGGATTNLVQADVLAKGAKHYRDMGWEDSAKSIEDISSSLSESITETAEKEGFSGEYAATTADSLLTFLKSPNSTKDTPTDYADKYRLYETSSENYNEAFQVPIIDSASYQQAADLVIAAERDLEKVSGVQNANQTYDFILNPDRKSEYESIVAQVTLQKGAPLEPWERMQIRQRVADPTTEILGGLVFDVLNLLDLPVGSILSKIDNTSDTYKALSKLGNVEDLSLGSLITKGAWSVTGKPVFDTVGGALASHWLVRNFGYQSALPLSNAAITNKIYNDVDNIVAKNLGGAANIVDNPIEDMGDFIVAGEKYSKLKAEGVASSDIIQTLLKDESIPATLRTSDRLKTVGQMVDIVDPIKEGRKGSWKRVFTRAYDQAFEEAHGKKLAEMWSLVNKSDPTQATGVEYIDNIIRGLDDAPEGQQLAQLYRALDNEALQYAKATIKSDDFAKYTGEIFSGAFEDTHTIAQYKGAKVLDGGTTGAFVKLFPNSKDALAKTYYQYKRFMSGFINTILNRRGSMKYYNFAENLAMHAASGKGDIFTRTSNLFSNTSALFDNIMELPVEARKGYFSFLGVEDLQDVGNLQKLLKENPDAWLPTPGSFELFFDKAKQTSHEQWLDKLLESKGLGDSLSKEMFLDKIAQDNKLFALVDAPNGKVATFMGKPVRFPTASLNEYNKAWADANRTNNSMNELVVKATIAQEHYISGLRVVSPLTLDEALTAAKDVLKNSGASDSVLDEAISRIRNNWDIAGGDTNKFVARARKDLLTQQGFRADTPIPDELRNMNMGMTAQEQENFLISVRDELNDYLTAVKLSGESPTPEHVHKFFTAELEKQITEINEALNPNGHAAYTIFGDDIGTALPVSDDTRKLLDNYRAGKAPKKYTAKLKETFAKNGVDVTGKTVQEATEELISKVTYVGSTTPARTSAEKVVSAIEQSVPYKSISQSIGPDFTIDPLDQQLRLRMLELDPIKEPGTKSTLQLIMEDFHEQFPDASINAGYEQYGNARGAFNGEVLYRLQELAPSDPQAKIVYDTLLEYDRNVETAYRLLRDRILPFVFPGYKWVSGPGTGAAQRVMFQQTDKIIENLLIQSGNNLETITAAVKSGQAVSIPTIGDVFGWAGISMETAEDGNTIARFLMLDPITGQQVAFTKGDEFFDALYDDVANFGIKNKAVWDAPITTPKFELRDLKLSNYVPNPVFRDVPEEARPLLRQEFMNAYLSKPFDENYNLKFYIAPFVQGEDIAKLSPDEIVARLRKASGNYKDNVAQAINETTDHIESVDKYFVQRFLLDEERVATPFTPATLPEQVRAWGNYKVTKGSQAEGVKQALIKWEDLIQQQAKTGRIYPNGMLTAAETAQIDKAMDVATVKMAEMEDALWKGGTAAGVSLDGAIPYMKSRMRVADENIIDSFMKGIVPFWNFTTRGGAAWVRIALEHPNVLAWYGKYMRFSEASAIQAGLTNSSGQQLPSSKGKIRLTQIPGLQLWYNPLSFSPFYSYYFSNNPINKYDDEDPNLTAPQNALRQILKRSEAFGARVSPVVDLLVTTMGVEDQYTTQSPVQKSASLLAQAGGIPTDLLPPFVWNGIDSLMRKSAGLSETDTWRPQEKWFDPLVEQSILRDYLMKIKSAGTEDERIALAEEARQLVIDREVDPKYYSYVDSVRTTDYFQTVAGWFTGVYAKPYYDGDLELYNLRDTNNALKKAINDEILAQVFYPDSQPVDRYNSFMDTRYNTGEGGLYTLRNRLSWVHDPVTGEVLEGEERREEASKLLEVDKTTTALYDELQGHYEKYNNLIRGLSIGAEFKDPRAAQWREDLWNSIAATENKDIYKDAQRDWTVGFKPQQLVDEHFEKLWYKMLRATYPKWNRDEFETWKDYQDRVRAWELNLPSYAEQLGPLFANQVLITYGQSTYYEEQDVLGIVQRLQKEASPELYYQIEMQNDTVVEALLRGWEELYFNKWWNDLGDLSGAMRAELIPVWYQQNPKPTTDQLIEWVQSNPTYSGKWTDEQLRAATMTSDELDAQQRQILDAQQAEQVGKTESELAVDETFDKLWWVPANRKSEFYKLMAVEGANFGIQSSDLDMFYEFSDIMALKDPQKFEALRTTLDAVYDRMQISRPIGTELSAMSTAQQLNDEFKKMMEIQLGANYAELVYAYGAMTSAERRLYRKENPDQMEIINSYYTLKDQYGKMNPVWKEYYNSSSSSKSGGYGYGYGGGGGGGGSSSETFVPIGMRSTEDANKLLSPENLGKGGVAGMPSLPREFWGKTTMDLRQEVYSKVTSGKALSSAATGFLSRTAERYPQWAGEINAVIGGT